MFYIDCDQLYISKALSVTFCPAMKKTLHNVGIVFYPTKETTRLTATVYTSHSYVLSIFIETVSSWGSYHENVWVTFEGLRCCGVVTFCCVLTTGAHHDTVACFFPLTSRASNALLTFKMWHLSLCNIKHLGEPVCYSYAALKMSGHLPPLFHGPSCGDGASQNATVITLMGSLVSLRAHLFFSVSDHYVE